MKEAVQSKRYDASRSCCPTGASADLSRISQGVVAVADNFDSAVQVVAVSHQAFDSRGYGFTTLLFPRYAQ